MFNFVRGSVSAWTDWFVVLDAEVYTCDAVFARYDTNLVSCLVLETRRRGVENHHVIFLTHQLLHLVTEFGLMCQDMLAIHDIVLGMRDHLIQVRRSINTAHLAALQIARLNFGAEGCLNFI